MKRRYLAFLLVFLLFGCAALQGEPPTPAPQLWEELSPQEKQREIEAVAAMPFEELTHRLAEEPQKMSEEYLLMAGTDWELPVSVLRGQEPGVSVYIVGGIHGDEPAGWLAGQRMQQAKLTAGTVYLASPVNQYGSKTLQRKTREGWDLNRHFPGAANGTDAERIAAALYADIVDKAPTLVLDLHEALAPTWERDALQNTIICHSVEEIGDLVLEILDETEAGRLCSGPFSLYGSPPQGSIHRVVTEQAGIPVITIETDRQQPLKERVANQLDLIGYILAWHGLGSAYE